MASNHVTSSAGSMVITRRAVTVTALAATNHLICSRSPRPPRRNRTTVATTARKSAAANTRKVSPRPIVETGSTHAGPSMPNGLSARPTFSGPGRVIIMIVPIIRTNPSAATGHRQRGPGRCPSGKRSASAGPTTIIVGETVTLATTDANTAKGSSGPLTSVNQAPSRNPQNVVTSSGPDACKTRPTTFRGRRSARIAPTEAKVTTTAPRAVKIANQGPATATSEIVTASAVMNAAPRAVIVQTAATTTVRRDVTISPRGATGAATWA